MTSLTKITWTSITVLPPLIGLCVGVALVTVLMLDLSLHLGTGLLFGVLALAEVGYLCILILVNRRKGALPVASER